MNAAGAARAAMRQRGEFLLVMESDRCTRFVAPTGAAGAGGASVDEIVAGLRSYPGAGGGAASPTGFADMSSARRNAGSAPAVPSPRGRASTWRTSLLTRRTGAHFPDTVPTAGPGNEPALIAAATEPSSLSSLRT